MDGSHHMHRTAIRTSAGRRAVYDEYEQQHRLRMARGIIPVFMILAVLLLLGVSVAAVFTTGQPADQVSYILIGLTTTAVIILLLFARRTARRARLSSTIALIACAGIAGTIADVVIWIADHPLDASDVIVSISFCAVIVLIGLLADVRSIVLTTLLLNAVTCMLLFFMPRATAMNGYVPFITASLLVLQWLFVALMVMAQRGFYHLLTEIDTAYERSRQLDSLKDAFISSVNHEIRTPLTSMVMYIDTLKRQHQQMPPSQLQFGLERASDIGQSLSDLVKSILSTRQVEQEVADLSFEVLPLLRLIKHTLTLLDPKEGGAAMRDLRLLVSPTVIAWADRVKVEQVLLNLLSNALKYSEPGTPIEIRASYTMLDVTETARNGRKRIVQREMVEVTIRDFGHGIEPEQIPLLFQKFVRLPADLASKVPGNGLGLYLCRLLIEAMGGSIWVESDGMGTGSTFFFRLPVPPPQFETMRNETVKAAER
jgi:signal transduction histidine kinase